MKVLITGRPGTGKSTIAAALQARGYNAVDFELVPNGVRLEYRDTHLPAEWPTDYVDWQKYAWNIQPGALESLFKLHAQGDVYVAISASNLERYYKFFDMMFVLTVDSPATLKRRLETRNAHSFNQNSENIQLAIDNYASRTAAIVADGLVPIDTSVSIESTIASIIEKTHDN